MFTKEFETNGIDYMSIPLGTTPTQPSMTVPGEDISVTDLIRKYESGNIDNLQFPEQDGPDQDFDDSLPRGMDVFDAYEEYGRRMSVIRQCMNDRQKERLKAQERSEYERLKAIYDTSNKVAAVSSDAAAKAAESGIE